MLRNVVTRAIRRRERIDEGEEVMEEETPAERFESSDAKEKPEVPLRTSSTQAVKVPSNRGDGEGGIRQSMDSLKGRFRRSRST